MIGETASGPLPLPRVRANRRSSIEDLAVDLRDAGVLDLLGEIVQSRERIGVGEFRISPSPLLA